MYLITDNCVSINGDGIPEKSVDLNGDKEIQKYEADLVETLVIGIPENKSLFNSIQDISLFTNMKKLFVSSDFGLTEISNLGLEKLEYINVNNNSSINSIDLSDLKNLKSIFLEGLNGVRDLNLQNGSAATEDFSMFYTYVDYACVDSIDSEYNYVLEHLKKGGTISTNCSLTGVNIDSEDNNIITLDTKNSQLFINEKFEMVKLYDSNGRHIDSWSENIKPYNLSVLHRGIYFLIIEKYNRQPIYKSIINY